jgi:hypothetical protein
MLGIFYFPSPFSSMTHWSFNNVLFSVHVFEDFLCFLLLLISSFIPVWSGRVRRLFQFSWICPKILSILEKVPWTAEKNVYCAASGWNVLQMSVQSTGSVVSFNSEASLLIFWGGLDDLSIHKSRVLKSRILLTWGLSVIISPAVFVQWRRGSVNNCHLL